MTAPTNDLPYVASIQLDRASSTPLYEQIAAPLAALIADGTIAPGRLLEDELSLAGRLSVSRPTARRAMSELVSQGLVTRRRGAGTHVTPPSVRRTIALTSLYDDLRQGGMRPRTRVLSYEVRLAEEADATTLGIDVGDEVVAVTRLRLVGDQPLAVMRNLLPAAGAPSLERLREDGLYAGLRAAGIIPAHAHQSMGARLATLREAELLELAHPAAILTMQRDAYDAAGRVVEHGDHVYSAELYSFELNLDVG